MVWRELFHISLARKCQLLFGLAVLLIIAATLFVPGYFMESLVHELNVQKVRQLALVARARINPSAVDWDQEQKLLDQWWVDNLRNEVLPRLIPLPIATDLMAPSLDIVLSIPANPPRWLRRCWTIGSFLAQASTTMQCIQAGYESVPLRLRSKLIAHTHRLFPRMSLLINQGVFSEPKDSGLRKAIKEMQLDESRTEWSNIIYEPGCPRSYRFILPIRGIKKGLESRPLVAVIDIKRPIHSDNDLLWTRAILVLAGLLAGFLAILVFYLISQKLILAPVRELKACAERISGGDMSARAALSTGDEFEALSVAFNDMLGQLDRSRIELETINRSLDAKLGEMAQTNVALFESNKLKSEFLANVSHELRTPLTSIIGFADLLRDAASSDSGIDKARFARYAHNILTSGRGLLDIINDLLDLAKIEAGRIELHRSRFSVRDVAEALYDLTRPLFDKKNIVLDMELSDDLPMMNSDPGKLRQILYNLLSNASKYTPEGGQVRMLGETLDENRRIRLVVADTGPGIDPDQHEQVFEKFRQLDSSATREHSGTGLGLAITRELSNMLGGNIRLESELGKGATFIVELPIECPEIVQRTLPSLT